MSARPNGKPEYYINSANSSGDSYLSVEAFFHFTNFSLNINNNTYTITLYCGVNVGGTSTGQNGSFDNIQSYVNIYDGNGQLTMTPPISIPVGYDARYSITTSGSYTNNLSLRVQGTIYAKASGGNTQRNVSTSFDETFDVRIVGSQINIVSTNTGRRKFIFFPSPLNGMLTFVKNAVPQNIFVMPANSLGLDAYTNGTVTLNPGACISAAYDQTNNQWWITTYYGNSTGSSGQFSNDTTSLGGDNITQPVVWRINGASDVAVNLPDPSTFSSTILAVILSSGTNTSSLFIKTSSFLSSADNIFSTGIKVGVGGYGGGGDKGNASVFLISDKSKWYIAAIQSSEYLEYYDTSSGGGTSTINQSICVCSDNIVLTLPSFSITTNNSRLFFIKKNSSASNDTPRIACPDTTGYFIGAPNPPSGLNYSASIVGFGGNDNSAYEAYCMLQMNTASNGTGYFFLGYYPWKT